MGWKFAAKDGGALLKVFSPCVLEQYMPGK
jgi:hypothetical protein